VPDFSGAHPTNTRDGAALLTERFAARVNKRPVEAAPEAPSDSASVAARLIATWFAPVQPVEEDH
jgi:hypothetical protein